MERFHRSLKLASVPDCSTRGTFFPSNVCLWLSHSTPLRNFRRPPSGIHWPLRVLLQSYVHPPPIIICVCKRQANKCGFVIYLPGDYYYSLNLGYKKDNVSKNCLKTAFLLDSGLEDFPHLEGRGLLPLRRSSFFQIIISNYMLCVCNDVALQRYVSSRSIITNVRCTCFVVYL
ncbi:unnamed protein product [Lepeophtheirus salmonis]|uniref:(salmon louse) hypothetical protein n=1 Tax=Lepeophtheirus salmonis TaxID=72036 RepID=A0A7R8D2I2_LEPSM|nr:unnamed protein product [Lepeophtheirus salmonis]CAF3005836.1 unnamed protein product [Lepeophtheirus salmonis]